MHPVYLFYMDMLPVEDAVIIDQRTVLVTGGTDGIGRATALHLAHAGHRVLITGRHHERGEAVVQEMRQAAAHRSGAAPAFVFLPADLTSTAGTIAVVDRVGAMTEHLDGVVCCAGAFAMQPQWTAEGLERSFMLNYLSRFLLVGRLLPKLIRSTSGRVVLVANPARYCDTLDLEKLGHGIAPRGLRLAGGTQFANDIFAIELAERCRDTALEITCVYPGIVATDLFRHAQGLPPLLGEVLVRLAARIGRSPQSAALTPAWLAAGPDAVGVSGRFFGPERTPIPPPARVLGPERRAEIWRTSEELLRPLAETVFG